MDMLPSRPNNVIEESISETIQSSVRKDPSRAGGIHILSWLTAGSAIIPPWWSFARDIELRKFWKRSDHLSGAMYAMQAKMTAIPKKIVAIDQTNRDHVLAAQYYQSVLDDSTEFGMGWEAGYGKFVEDLIGTDNGGFMEVIGPGRPDGPLTGPAISVSHLDSTRCRRTGNPEYPVVYNSFEDGKLHKLHYTRVMFASLMPSPIEEMYSVGFCSVSRAIHTAQTLIDILNYKMEKLGSRPARGMMVTRGGLDPDDILIAFRLADDTMDSQNLSRYSKIVVAGHQAIPDADVKLVNLSGLPEGFDEESSTVFGMAVIALAFGVDARELFPAMSAGATRADALLSHLKQRGKGPGQILAITERLFNQKFLPSYLKLAFDFQDDAEDKQAADIRKTRSDTRLNDLTTGISDVRTSRELMVTNGEITQQQFDRMELDSGRLPNGNDVLSLLFAPTSPTIEKIVDLGIENPLDTFDNMEEDVLEAIAAQRAVAYKMMRDSLDVFGLTEVQKGLAALDALESYYTTDMSAPESKNPQDMQNSVDNRQRTIDLTQPNPDTELNSEDSLKPSGDDE